MAVFYSALGLTVLCIAARCVLGRNRAHYKALAWIMYCMAVLKMGLGLTIVATNPKCPDSCSGCHNATGTMILYAFICFALGISWVGRARVYRAFYRPTQPDPVVVMAEPVAAHETIHVAEQPEADAEADVPPSYGEAVVVTLDGIPSKPASSTLHTTLLSQPH